MTTAHPTLVARLAELRQEVAGLLGDIDTRVKPRPDHIETGEHLPGPVWRSVDRWTVRVVDPDETPASVFVNHPHCYDDDIVPLDPSEARRIGMAFLAAADWADRMRTRAVHDDGACTRCATTEGELWPIAGRPGYFCRACVLASTGHDPETPTPDLKENP